MLDKKDLSHYWQYCLYIEKDLEDTTRFVEVCENNQSTYSAEYAQIISLACSEIDVICKLLCEEINPDIIFDNDKNKGTIKKYTNIILQRFPKLPQCSLDNAKTNESILPFREWSLEPYKSPNWWGNYQNIKHSRHIYFELANQKNAFYSVAGLIILNLYLYRFMKNEANQYPRPEPKIFDAICFGDHLVCSGHELLDFE